MQSAENPRATEPENDSRSGVALLRSVEDLQAVLPQYEILELLGRGGMGAVYQARQKSLKRLVAIKILPSRPEEDAYNFVERFRKEAETLAQMNHPAIVDVYDFGETTDGLLYFVMEYVEGIDAHEWIAARGALPAEEALRYTLDICDALVFAHRRGVIHRDQAGEHPHRYGRTRKSGGLRPLQDARRIPSAWTHAYGHGNGLARLRRAGAVPAWRDG